MRRPPNRVTPRHANRHFTRIGRRLEAAEATIEHARDALGRLAAAQCESRKARNTATWLVGQLAGVSEDLADAAVAHDRLMRIAAGDVDLEDLDHL
jgi:hypothetical protein